MVADGYKDTEIGVIPIDWGETTIDDLFDLGRGTVISKTYIAEHLGEYPIYSSQSKNKGCMGYIDTYAYDAELITWTTDGAYAGTVFHRNGKFNCTNVCGTVQNKKNSYTDLRFFTYFLSRVTKRYVSYIGNPKLMNGIFGTIKIPLPPLKEQEKIADILSTADDKIDAIAIQIEKAEILKKGLLQKLLSEGIGHSEFKETGLSIVYPMRQIPKAWSLETLSSITTKITDGAHFTPTYVESGIPFLRVTDLKSKDLLASKIKYIPEDEHLELLKRCKPEYGDILYSKNGTIGLTRIVTWDWEFSIFVSLCLIKPNRDLIIPEYLKYYLTSSIVDTQIKIRAKQGTVTNLHLEEIRDFFITIPPLKEQKQIADILSTADEKLEVLRAKKEKYEVLKKGLMQKLLSGEVRVGCVS